jgi:general secretion pathway protein G
MKLASRPMQGFTLIEVVITLALVGLIAMTSLPLYEVVSTRMRESELRVALRTVRAALDAYKAASDSGAIPREAGESGYPPNLDVLVQGVEIGNSANVSLSGKPTTQKRVFLRQVPRDPFNTDPALPAAQTWQTRAYGSAPESPQAGADVFDISSTVSRVGLNGIPYNSW